MKKKSFIVFCFSFILGLALLCCPCMNNGFVKTYSSFAATSSIDEDFSDVSETTDPTIDPETLEEPGNTEEPEEPIIFTVSFDANNNSAEIRFMVENGNTISKPETPTRTGYTFCGWFLDDGTFEQEYDFNNIVTEDFTLHAKWQLTEYTLEFVLNNGDSNIIIPTTYGQNISAPSTNPIFANHIFLGWFEDESSNRRFNFGTMPAENVKVFARWQAKRTVIVDLEVQTYEYGDANAFYKDFSDQYGFNVEYLIDGEWTTEIPKNAGSYDVKLSRTEDNQYASYENILKDGFVINYKELNLSWLIGLLFAICLLEVAAIVFVKKLKSMKTSKAYAIFPIVIGGNSIIPNSQFTLLVISGAFALLGFVYLIYSLVDVHRTAINDAYLPSKLDNRERFKDELIFQNTNEGDEDYITKTKTEESFGSKYSASDIKNMLVNDKFNEETLAKRKFNAEENTSQNWNKSSETDGSSVVDRAREINSIIKGEYDGRTATKFFEDDEDN